MKHQNRKRNKLHVGAGFFSFFFCDMAYKRKVNRPLSNCKYVYNFNRKKFCSIKPVNCKVTFTVSTFKNIIFTVCIYIYIYIVIVQQCTLSLDFGRKMSKVVTCER